MVTAASDDSAVGPVVDFVAKNGETAPVHHHLGCARVVYARVMDVIACDQGIRASDFDRAGPGVVYAAIGDSAVRQLSRRDSQPADIADFQSIQSALVRKRHARRSVEFTSAPNQRA